MTIPLGMTRRLRRAIAATRIPRMTDTSLTRDTLAPVIARLQPVNAELVRRYPGESCARQPVHTVYGGAQLFTVDTVPKLGQLARRAMDEYAPDARSLAEAIGLSSDSERDIHLAHSVHARVTAKLRREAVEDFRLDYEDGYGVRPDAEEDGHAASAAHEVASGFSAQTLPPFIGIRIKSLSGELRERSLRTAQLFLRGLLEETDGQLPQNFVTTLPKITSPAEITSLARLLATVESERRLQAGSLRMELMVETPQSIFDEHVAPALAALALA